jgi:hypothetical protein
MTCTCPEHDRHDRLAYLALEDCKQQAIQGRGTLWPEQLYTVPFFAGLVFRWLEVCRDLSKLTEEAP